MNIRTKFNVGDKAYWINDNTIQEVTIETISFSASMVGKETFYYISQPFETKEDAEKEGYGADSERVFDDMVAEDDLFKTPQELTNDLVKNINKFW